MGLEAKQDCEQAIVRLIDLQAMCGKTELDMSKLNILQYGLNTWNSITSGLNLLQPSKDKSSLICVGDCNSATRLGIGIMLEPGDSIRSASRFVSSDN